MNPVQRSLIFSAEYYMKKIIEDEIEQFELPLEIENLEEIKDKVIEEKEDERNRK